MGIEILDISEVADAIGLVDGDDALDGQWQRRRC